ncbi:hypothetical protein BOQ62_11945 [Chryseobacterium sp. CH21]|uniref:hypothetical protein n=1 Tax=Chryseobacterium sp. CH21 TaxID=713556 RepID=UPI00100C1F8A|nr:hypothetical protein [Chryseobacterium sp. CH21]RXM39380.1 hypothetical protein BOQ62_11945 [Chryseobacterium sp. CH21]
MNNYKKLLLAGLAIVPLALSSWTSEEPSTQFGNKEAKLGSTVEIIGNTAVSSSVTVNTKKKVLSKETVETISVASEKAISNSLETARSFNDILNDYK